MMGEQVDGAVGEVGHDRLDLATREHTVPIGRGGHRQHVEPPSRLGAAGGVAAGSPGVVPQPGGHGGGAVVAPHLGTIVLAHGRQELGIEPIGQRERLAQDRPVDGQVELVDRIGQLLEGAADLPGHDR